MLIPFDTLLPTTKPSTKPNCVALLLVEAFVLRDQETCIWPLVEPVEPHGHLTFRLREAATRERGSRKTGRDADPM